jgi:magnesium chelatase family protein
MLVAATNPCPCGYAGVGDRCTCSDQEVRRHQRRLSGPLLDRMDLLVNVERPTEAELSERPPTTSELAQVRVTQARERQRRRLEGTPAACNGEMDARTIAARVRLDAESQALLATAYATGSLSTRGRYRVIRVAQTLADLAGRDGVQGVDVLQALSLRQRMSHGETAWTPGG